MERIGKIGSSFVPGQRLANGLQRRKSAGHFEISHLSGKMCGRAIAGLFVTELLDAGSLDPGRGTATVIRQVLGFTSWLSGFASVAIHIRG